MHHHKHFLEQMGLDSALHRQWIGWIKTLPPFLDLGGIRVCHGWWSQPLIDRIGANMTPVLGVRVAARGIKAMKTKWGSCNASARRVWLNLELAKKPVPCIEYIVVHELAQLVERRHDDRFTALMDACLPNWRLRRELLNRSPLAHEEWAY